MKKKLFAVIRVLISFGLLGFLFWMMRNDIGRIFMTVKSSDTRFIFAGFALMLANLSLLAFRLKIIFAGENLYISVWQSLRLTFIGYFFNNFMPTAVGGDIVKAHYAAKLSSKRIQSYASVFMDRFIGLYSFVAVAGIALLIDKGRFELDLVRTLVTILLAFGVVGFIVATNRKVALMLERFFGKLRLLRIGERLNAVYKIVHDYRNRKDIILKSFLLSICAQSIFFVIVYVFFKALGYDVGLGNVFLIMPVVVCISMMPSLGGIGLREGAMVVFFSHLSSQEIAFTASLLLLSAYLFVSVIGGIFYISHGVIEVKE